MTTNRINPDSSKSSPVIRYLLLAMILLAFGLRIFRLAAQSYWLDEAWTIYFITLPFDDLLRLLQTEEPKPPFYYLTTYGWQQLFGVGEFSLRYYSLLFGVLAVPLTYRLGRALGDARLGLLAALLLAVSPYQIWHSQDARMYSIFTAAAALTMWGFVRWLQRDDWRGWLLYVIGLEWAILTHYHAVVLIGVQGLFLLMTWRRHWRRYLTWGGTLLLVALIYLPWLAVGGALLQNFDHWITQPASLWETYRRSAIAYSVGELMPAAQSLAPALFFVALYGLGLLAVTRRRWGIWRGSEMLAFLLAYTLAPNVAAWLYGLFRTPVYLERYLIPLQLGFFLAIAAALLAIFELRITNYELRIFKHFKLCLSQLLAGLLLTILIGISGWALWPYYTDPAYTRPDWRTTAQWVSNFEQPGDGIIITGEDGDKAFDFYYPGSAPRYLDFNTPVPPPAEARRLLETLANRHPRLWYTPYGVAIDPLIENWLRENSFPAWQQWLGRKRLALYHTQTNLAPPQAVNARFPFADDSGPELLSVAHPAGPTAAGDTLPLELTWRTESPLPADLQLSLRLINPQGDIFTQSDWPPLPPAAQWTPGQPLTDRRALWLPADVPPGDYLLQFVIYTPATGQPLGQPVTLPGITVAAAQITPSPEFLTIPNLTLHYSQLIGYAHPESIQPGQPMWLWLYWQATGPLAPDTNLQVMLTAGDESVATNLPLANLFGPLAGWQPQQVRRGIIHLPTSPRLQGDTAQLTVSLLEPDSPPTEFLLGDITLQTRARTFEAPAIATPLNATFGESPQITLLGYNGGAESRAQGAGEIDFTLLWRGEAEMETDYTVFVQLLDSAGQVVAQVDAPPLHGAAPTTTWLPGEIIADDISLTLPPNLPPGDYRLITGMYDAAGGARLPASTGGDFVELQTVTVE